MPAATSARSTTWIARVVALSTAALVVFALAPMTSAAAGDHGEDVCAPGSAGQAAVALFGPGTELVGTEQAAGLKTALVLEPRIYPGTRQRMIAAAGRWCEATTGFNRAWELAGRPVADGRALAEAYASLAAAPYFDGITVKRTTGAAGTWTVLTHARTNGVEARWAIITDAHGIRTATWTATAFGREPLEASWEGLTALP
ncbi:MAG TPA: hypothetical protein VHL78_07520, partial [Actinomycetota bacterium]|nr:hypothetical protein [Actinomycetota bacterium]